MKRTKNVYKRKDGRYEGRIPFCRDNNGKLKYHSVYAKTYQELLEKMERSFPETSDKTLQEITAEWLASMKVKVRESSYCRYETIVQRHIIPYFEDAVYQDINAIMANDFIEYLLEYGKSKELGGLSVKTVRDIITAFRDIARFAETKYGLPNHLVNLHLPKPDKTITPVLSSTELAKLQTYLLNNLNSSNLGILITIYSGLRIGELCALTWSDIDLVDGCIYISKTVQRLNDNSGEGGKTKIHIGKPKSVSSIREIPIPQFLLQILRKNKQNKKCYVLSGTIGLVEPRTLQ